MAQAVPELKGAICPRMRQIVLRACEGLIKIALIKGFSFHEERCCACLSSPRSLGIYKTLIDPEGRYNLCRGREAPGMSASISGAPKAATQSCESKNVSPPSGLSSIVVAIFRGLTTPAMAVSPCGLAKSA